MINLQGRDERDRLEAVLHGRRLGPLLSRVAVQLHHASAVFFFSPRPKASIGILVTAGMHGAGGALRQPNSSSIRPGDSCQSPTRFPDMVPIVLGNFIDHQKCANCPLSSPTLKLGSRKKK